MQLQNVNVKLDACMLGVLLHCCPSSCTQTRQLLGFLNSQGVRDGITGKRDLSVDGIPLSYHLNMLQTIKDIIRKA